MNIKVCGITNKEDAMGLAKLQIDYMGIIFYPPSQRFVLINRAKEIVSMIPQNIKRVGVFVNEEIKQIIEHIKDLHLDFVQLHGEESPAICESLRKYARIIKTFKISDKDAYVTTLDYENSCDYFLFEAPGKLPGGNGISFNWDILESYSGKIPFFLSGGISNEHEDVINSLNFKKFHAIDINSRFEFEPGIKNIELISTFVKNLKQSK